MTAIWRVWKKTLKNVWETDLMKGTIALNRQVFVEWNYITKTEWVNFTIWWALAKVFDNIVQKGDLVELNWSLQKNFKEEEDGSKTEYVDLKVSNFNLLGKHALYFNDRNSVDITWNITYINNDKELDDWNVIKNFSVVVDNSYKNKDWEEITNTNFWNIRMIIPEKLKDKFKEKLIVWRWINANWSLLFWESNWKRRSVIDVPFKTFYWCFLKKEEAQKQNESKIDSNIEETKETYTNKEEKYTNKEEKIKDEIIEEEVLGMPFTEEKLETQEFVKTEKKIPAKNSIEVDVW